MAKSKKTETPLEFLIAQAKAEPKISQLILFGSRSREDFHKTSDFDLAVRTTLSKQEWSRWALKVREEFPSLCGLDIVLLNSDTATALKQKVLQEGKVIYELSRK